MKFIPHEYQSQAIRFELDNPRCLLSLDMGLGKTAITLSAIIQLFSDYAVNRVLIIAPKFVASDVWTREVAKWDEFKNLRVSVAVGTEKQRLKALRSPSDIVCINRENICWLIENYEWDFDMVVIDESSSFKSSRAKRFKVLKRMISKTSRVVELTGTPRPRSLEDIWPQVYLLDQGKRLGRSMTAFREAYEVPGRRSGVQIWEWKPKPGAEDAVYQNLSDISMSMKATDWLQVPDEIVIDHFVDMDAKILKNYQKLQKESILQLSKDPIVGVNGGALIGKLLQYANGAVYVGDDEVEHIHDSKLEALAEILEQTSEPVLVFYWFQHDLQRLNVYLKDYKPKTLKTTKDIADWNNRRIKLLLAHPASMGHGLNLQDGGNTIVWFGLTWSLELYQQANARLHRQGQTQKVNVHRIIAKNTVDEDVIASLAKKDMGQEDLIEAIKARVRKEQI